ncbi:unnamed protein product [Triticum turgidum subsp. durum]|uniref:Uncharacterized protein n=1 Tax=Triticum turgidum subsp. durum TaxID=4567 RepID=A0A9R1BIK8_TRITD|nr:unnamed protein product [Triticum turgidum subsp. durum]
MRPFYTMLLALAIVVLCSDVVTEVVTANGGGATATVTPMDCKVLPTIPGICNPDKCMQYCQDRISGTSVGECVSDGCQCTYCGIPPSGHRD